MIVCVCKAVSDRHIRQALKDGVAETFDDLQIDLGVATCCGKCEDAARAVVTAHHAVERAKQDDTRVMRVIPITRHAPASTLNSNP